MRQIVLACTVIIAAMTGANYHVQHVSSAATLELVRAAKSQGMPVTAEVAPHHLWFTDESVQTMDPVYKMYPPLRSESDVAALRAGLLDGTVDAVATDHAPHAAHEKDVPFEEAPRGVIGLETAVGAVVTATGLGPVELFTAMSVNPARIAGLETHGRWPEVGAPANLTAVDFENGEELWDRLISPGTGTIIAPLSSVTAPVVLGPNGAAYVGIRTGVVMAKDRAG